MIPYEDRFDLDRDWGWTQGGRHFRRDSDLFRVLRRLAGLLADRGISYAVMGGMALFEHGYERFTTDIDLLVTPEGLRAIHDRPEALGCMRPDPERKSIRDLETGVRVDFLVAGTFPGDGKPKPVAFPDPAQVGVNRDGVIYLCLPSLIELKLASGMTAGMSRLRDFADIIEWMKILKPPADFAEQLHPFVRDRFAEFWAELQKPAHEP